MLKSGRIPNRTLVSKAMERVSEDLGLPDHVRGAIAVSQMAKRSAAIQSTRIATPVFHPQYEISTLRLPQTLEDKNVWRRHWYRYDPYVSRAIDLHTRFPLSQFQIQCDDPGIRRDYEDLVADLDLFQLFLWIAQEYWVVGESIPYGVWNPEECAWSHFLLMNPDFVDIQWNPVLKDDKAFRIVKWADPLKSVVSNGPRNEDTGKTYRQLAESNPELVECIRNNRPYELNPLCTSHISRRVNYFDIRGTGLIDATFKTLVYKDKLMEAQGAIADRHVNVKEFYMLGEAGEPATPDEYDQFDMLLRQSWTAPNQAIVWNHALRIQMEGASGKILPLSPEFQHILEELAAGLKVPIAFLAGQGVPYANASVSLDVMIAEYGPFRETLETWAQRNVFEPVARARGYHRPRSRDVSGRWSGGKGKTRDRELILPTLSWSKSVLRDNYQRLQTLISLAEGGRIPWELVYQELNLYPDEIKGMLARQREEEKDLQATLQEEMGLGFPSAPPPGGALDMGGGVPVGIPRAPFAPAESFEGLGEGVSPMEPTPAEEPILE